MIKKLILFVTVLMWSILVATAQPTATDFGINDASGNQNTFIQVPVNITNVQNVPVASIIFDINFDSNIINLTSARVKRGDLTSTWDVPGFNPANGRISIVFGGSGTEILNGSSGSVITLNFSVIGVPGAKSVMNISRIQLGGLDGSLGTASAKNGTFTITGGAPTPTLTLTLNATWDSSSTVSNFTKAVLLNTAGTQVATATLPDNMTAQFSLSGIIPGDYFIEVNDRAGDRVPTRIDSNASDINQSVGTRLRYSVIGALAAPTYRIKARLGGHSIVNYTTGANETGYPFVIVSTNPNKIEVREVNTSRQLSNWSSNFGNNHDSTGTPFQEWILDNPGANTNHGKSYQTSDTCTGCHGSNLSTQLSNYPQVVPNNGWCFKCHYGKGGDGKGFVDPFAQPQAPQAGAPAITSWGNSKTNNASSSITVNVSETVRFNASANQSITTWNWFLNDVNQNDNFDNFSAPFASAGTYTVKANATNTNGTSNTVMWNVNVQPTSVVISGISLSVSPSANQVTIPGVVATYNLTLTNTGNKTDNYTLNYINPNNASTVNLNPSSVQNLGAGNSTNILLNVTNTSAGKFMVNVTATSQNDPGKNKSVSTITTVLSANIVGFTMDSTGKLGRWINASVNVTNYNQTTGKWFVIDVSGVSSTGESLVGTGTVFVNANTTVNNVPVLITVPGRVPTGNYQLIAGLWKLEEFPIPELVITTQGPKTVTIS